MSESQPLGGRVALVTGVSRRIGIGFGLAKRMLADGARVFASGWVPFDEEMPWGKDTAGTEAMVAELGGPGERLHYQPFDLEDAEGPGALVSAVLERFGALDIVIASHARSSHDTLETTTVLELDRCWAANVRSCIQLAQELGARRDPSRPGGRMIMFTSGQHIGPMPKELGYAVTKGAIHQMTATLADALADRGITVNTINPGPVDTGYAKGRALETIAAMFPAKRWGTPEDVANLVSFLCSDQGAWITGQVIVSEGGFRRWARVQS